MPILPPLNDDCTLIVISHLNKRAILSLAHASSVALAALRPYVLRTVSLRRNAEQVNEFCQCVLSQDLAGYIRDLDISPSALYPAGSDPTPGSDDEPKPVIFARALADVLEKSVNLKALKLAGLEILLECEPRIGAALIAHPPHAKLELSGIGERGFVALGSMRSPPNISLQPSPPFNSTMARNIQAGDCITAFLTRNAELFQDVVFGGLISRWLDTFLKSHSLTFPNVHKLVMHPLDMSLRQCAMAFPAVRYLSADWPEPAIADGQVLWPDLLSIEGPSPLVFYAALNYPNIRRIHLWDKYHMEPEDEFAGLCTIMQQRAIVSLSLSVDYLPQEKEFDQNSIDWLVSRRISPNSFWSQLSQALPRARFIEIRFRRPETYSTIAADTLAMLTDSTVAAMDTVQGLRYVSFGLRKHSFPPQPHPLVDTPGDTHPTSEDIASFWFFQCPSLEYVELNLQILGWERSWWRRHHIYEPTSDESASQCGVLRISEDEGLCAREIFDNVSYR